MRRFLRLLTLWLIALALPLQGATAAVAMGASLARSVAATSMARVALAAASQADAGVGLMAPGMVMPDGSVMAEMRADSSAKTSPQAKAEIPSQPRPQALAAMSPNARTLATQALEQDAPCLAHARDKTGCGACCGPTAAQQSMLAVAPVAARWAASRHVAAAVPVPVFLTSGTDRPPRPLLG